MITVICHSVSPRIFSAKIYHLHPSHIQHLSRSYTKELKKPKILQPACQSLNQ